MSRLRLSLRRWCQKEAKTARNLLIDPAKRGEKDAFERGYNLGYAHAYELLLKHKLRAKDDVGAPKGSHR